MTMLALIAISAVLRIAYLFVPTIIWWDSAIYIGMGKYIYTGGKLGLWEPFRPVAWPLVLGFFWKIGIDPATIGKIIVVAAAVGAIYLVYKIGEAIDTNTGLFAATMFAFTPVFFAFANVPITDIPTTFLTTLAAYLALRERYFLSGLAISFAFVFRFPQAVIFFPIILAIIILKKNSWREALGAAIKTSLGFGILVAAHMTQSIILYGDPFFIVTWAQRVVSVTPGRGTWLYYPSGMIIENPFYVFALVFFVAWLFNFKSWIRHRAIVITSLCFLAGIAYFTSQAHKEMRYAIAFLPFAALAAGHGISLVYEKIRPGLKSPVPTMILLAVVPALIGIYSSQQFWLHYRLSPEHQAYYTFFEDKAGASVMASSPQIVAVADVKLVNIFDVWEDAADALTRQTNNVDYIAVDSCQLTCMTKDKCQTAKMTAEEIFAKLTPIFETRAQYCTFTVYKGGKK